MDLNCEKCGAICVIRATTMGKNIGRRYFSCQHCQQFVMWVEHLKQCLCGAGNCKVRTAKTARNNGRQFWCCPHSTGVDNPGCGMFQWIEGTMTDTAIGEGTGTDTVNVEIGESSHQTIESSQTQAIRGTSAQRTPPSNYLRGYLRGVIRANAQNSKMFEDILDAVEKLDLNNPDERES